MIITIDGPAGSGKSAVSRRVARSLGLSYLDTGAMYRAITFEMLSSKIKTEDSNGIENLLSHIRLSFVDDKIHINSIDRSTDIRTPEIDREVSAVSALASVRKKLVELQRAVGAESDIVADGRDMGSVVFPRADYKFYLDALPEIRAHRRFLELRAKGAATNEHDILEDLIRRDRYDMNRKISPLIIPDDAVVIDTSHLNIDEVCARIFDITGKRGENKNA